MTCLTNDDPTMIQVAEEAHRQWQAIGVDVTIRSIDAGAVSTFVRNRNFDAALIEIGLAADPDPYPLWHSTQAGESGPELCWLCQRRCRRSDGGDPDDDGS